MIEFAVQIEGEANGRWVLAVDPAGERLLIANEDRTLRWVPMAECKFLKASTPDVPRLVVPVQGQQPQKIAMPVLHLNGGRGN